MTARLGRSGVLRAFQSRIDMYHVHGTLCDSTWLCGTLIRSSQTSRPGAVLQLLIDVTRLRGYISCDTTYRSYSQRASVMLTKDTLYLTVRASLTDGSDFTEMKQST